MTAFTFSILNQAGVAADEIAAFCAAQEEKTAIYMVPFYSDLVGTKLALVDAPSAPAGTVPLVLAPTASVANTLGYHETTPDGFPIAIVELDACRAAGVPWTVAASHEVDETGQNPFLKRFVTCGTRTYPWETDDPVTGDEVLINGVALANAVTPAFYEPNSPSTARFDLMDKLHQSIAAGVPHGGWLEWSENGVWANGWGADVAPERVEYMRNRQGRRWRLRGRVWI